MTQLLSKNPVERFKQRYKKGGSIPKFQNPSGPLRLHFSPEFEAYVQSLGDASKMNKGVNSNSNTTVTAANSKVRQSQAVEEQTDKANKRIADKHAHRAVQERDQRRRNQQNGVSSAVSQAESDKYAAKHGEVKNGNSVQLDKALSWYGLSNGLGQMSNVSDVGRNTRSFGDYIGNENVNMMAM